MNREEQAVHYFRNGFNCAQSVAASFQDVVKMNEKDLLRVAGGFGAGMGRQQLTCGAVSGAYIVIGALYGKTGSDDAEAGEKTYSLVRKFADEFKKLYDTTACADLLGCDLMTEEGQAEFSEKEMKVNICEKCVADAVKITEKLINI